jgi:hypothetical protein
MVPAGPQPGSNGIGLFSIGVSPVGTIPPFSYWSTVISQYANSSILTGIIASFQAATDQTENFDALYDNIFNIQTAQGYGLQVWGRVVNVSSTVELPLGTLYFGFEEGAGQPFGQAAFYSGENTTSNFTLSDPAFRTLIYAKALSNISDGSIPSINKILLTLFPNRGNCYVADNGAMNLTYTFLFPLTEVEEIIVQQDGVLPKPVGVKASFSFA